MKFELKIQMGSQLECGAEWRGVYGSGSLGVVVGPNSTL
jgi:hypothetical protein